MRNALFLSFTLAFISGCQQPNPWVGECLPMDTLEATASSERPSDEHAGGNYPSENVLQRDADGKCWIPSDAVYDVMQTLWVTRNETSPVEFLVSEVNIDLALLEEMDEGDYVYVVIGDPEADPSTWVVIAELTEASTRATWITLQFQSVDVVLDEDVYARGVGLVVSGVLVKVDLVNVFDSTCELLDEDDASDS